MISLLIAIAVGIVTIAGIVTFIFQFAPQIVEWLNNSVETISSIMTLLPAWIIPYCLVGVALAFISLGVKLL